MSTFFRLKWRNFTLINLSEWTHKNRWKHRHSFFHCVAILFDKSEFDSPVFLKFQTNFISNKLVIDRSCTNGECCPSVVTFCLHRYDRWKSAAGLLFRLSLLFSVITQYENCVIDYTFMQVAYLSHNGFYLFRFCEDSEGVTIFNIDGLRRLLSAIFLSQIVSCLT